jgi:restriction system protein
MPIPDFQTAMLPLMKDLSQGERHARDTADALAKYFALTPEELAVRLPSGRQTKFTNRIAWAKAHLKAAGLIESPRRAVYRLTDRGRDVLNSNPPTIGMPFLTRYPEYVAFRQRSSDGSDKSKPSIGNVLSPASADVSTPDDLIDRGARELRIALAADLRERIAAMQPAAFEQLVVDVLTAMGYGGPQENAGIVVGKGGDEGIDGVIREDRLGLDTIYIQAKRWQGTVGRPDIQRFSGALQGQRARKGVFITSSTFSNEARQYANSIQTTIALIDGAQLADLMIDHNVGVTTAKHIEIKRIDSDYFSAE